MSITRINTNTDALLAGANLTKVQFDMSRTLSHLSTGLRIVTGADDPSGMGLSATFKAQMGGITQAIQNAQDGLSLMQTADSALAGNMDILTRIYDICVKASSDIYTDAERTTMTTELDALQSEITTRSAAITFNTQGLFTLDGNVLQVGPDNSTTQQLTISLPAQTTTACAVDSAGNAADGITEALAAIDTLAADQATVGWQEKQLERVINDLSSLHVNISAASSRITDADMASEISAFAKQQVLVQAAAAMVSQANAMPVTVMKILGIGQ